MLTAKASPESQIRYQYAQAIVAHCPETLFSQIALMGSAARGIANAQSDLDILAWSEAIPPLANRRAFLANAGLESIAEEDEARPDGSFWIACNYHGIDMEMGWQSFAAVENSLSPLLTAQSSNHRELRLGELFLSAKSLRGSGILEKWQTQLANYPHALHEKLIHEVLETWLVDSNLSKENLLRLLFALNCQWEINWKWAHTVELSIAPANFFSRLENVAEWQALLAEILALLPTETDLRELSIQKLNL